MMVSFICACNNKDLVENMLISSLKCQKCQDFEVIVIDAKEYGFNSASQTLNYGASISNGDILVFVHQDIKFENDSIVDKIVMLSNNNNFGIAGVAGVEFGKKQVFSSIYHGINHSRVGETIDDVKEVASLDECLLIIKKKDFKGFREYNSWHFYGVEYSLRCFTNNEKVLLFPLELYHLSPGNSLNDNYWITLKKVSRDFKSLKFIPTTFAQFRNNFLLKFQIIKLKKKLKRRGE